MAFEQIVENKNTDKYNKDQMTMGLVETLENTDRAMALKAIHAFLQTDVYTSIIRSAGYIRPKWGREHQI